MQDNTEKQAEDGQKGNAEVGVLPKFVLQGEAFERVRAEAEAFAAKDKRCQERADALAKELNEEMQLAAKSLWSAVGAECDGIDTDGYMINRAYEGNGLIIVEPNDCPVHGRVGKGALGDLLSSLAKAA